MFSKRVTLLVCLLLFLAAGLIWFSGNAEKRLSVAGVERIGISLAAPFQRASTATIRTVKNVWRHYFHLVHASRENNLLKKQLRATRFEMDRCREIELSADRLRTLLEFKETRRERMVAAEVVARDPSPWFKSIIIDKGFKDGIRKGFPVVVPEGIAGQVIDVSARHAKVLLIIDRNSSVDGLVQRTRARGIVKGLSTDRCFFDYVPPKADVRKGDRIVSSGLDGVYPKGLTIGKITQASSNIEGGMFQNITIRPDVNFEKIEEVLVIMRDETEEPLESGENLDPGQQQ